MQPNTINVYNTPHGVAVSFVLGGRGRPEEAKEFRLRYFYASNYRKMKNAITLLCLVIILGIGNNKIYAQSATFKCYEINYGEGKGWENVNFKIILDAGNYKLHVYDPRLELHIKLYANGLQGDDTYQYQGIDQNGLRCNVYTKTNNPQMITVQYNENAYQYYKVKQSS